MNEPLSSHRPEAQALERIPVCPESTVHALDVANPEDRARISRVHALNANLPEEFIQLQKGKPCDFPITIPPLISPDTAGSGIQVSDEIFSKRIECRKSSISYGLMGLHHRAPTFANRYDLKGGANIQRAATPTTDGYYPPRITPFRTTQHASGGVEGLLNLPHALEEFNNAQNASTRSYFVKPVAVIELKSLPVLVRHNGVTQVIVLPLDILKHELGLLSEDFYPAILIREYRGRPTRFQDVLETVHFSPEALRDEFDAAMQATIGQNNSYAYVQEITRRIATTFGDIHAGGHWFKHSHFGNFCLTGELPDTASLDRIPDNRPDMRAWDIVGNATENSWPRAWHGALNQILKIREKLFELGYQPLPTEREVRDQFQLTYTAAYISDRQDQGSALAEAEEAFKRRAGKIPE